MFFIVHVLIFCCAFQTMVLIWDCFKLEGSKVFFAISCANYTTLYMHFCPLIFRPCRYGTACFLLERPKLFWFLAAKINNFKYMNVYKQAKTD